METETFLINAYLRTGQASHVAHKELARRWPAKAHDHDYYELFLIEHGQTDHWINGTRQRLGRGRLVFVRPNDAHAFRADQRTGCRIFNVMFRTDTVQHFVNRYPEDFSKRLFDGRAGLPEMYTLRDEQFDQALKLANRLMNGSLSLAQVEEFLLAFSNQVLRPEPAEELRMPNWLADACRALRSPSVFRKGTAGFVAVAGRSHEHLCRSCKSYLGTTPSAYVNRIRANYAAERLVRTQVPIAEISSEIGIENLGHFYRLFRQHFGTTPRAFRLSNQKNPFE